APGSARSLGWDAQLGQERIRVELSAERRLGTVTGVDDGVAPVAVDESPDRLEEGLPVAAGEVDAADRTCEQQVAGEDDAAGRERDVPGRVARHLHDLEFEARDRDRVAVPDRVLGLVRADECPAARSALAKRVELARRSPDL